MHGFHAGTADNRTRRYRVGEWYEYLHGAYVGVGDVQVS